jgi:hypothetical protein
VSLACRGRYQTEAEESALPAPSPYSGGVRSAAAFAERRGLRGQSVLINDGGLATKLQARGGQPLADAFAIAAGVPEIVAIGVNCCALGDRVGQGDIAELAGPLRRA